MQRFLERYKQNSTLTRATIQRIFYPGACQTNNHYTGGVLHCQYLKIEHQVVQILINVISTI